MKSKHFEYLDLMRIMLLVSVFLYHLDILKGGYLAVCSFFVLSGYLAVISGFKKEKFSFKEYYLSRLKKIYLPLLAVVFVTIGAISFFSSINWINLKPETFSVIFGYNNYWQLSANLDYFVRHVESPFMHLWYIAILLQFELVFPFIFVLFRKIGDKIKKIIPCIILLILAGLSFTLFYLKINDGNLMGGYYDTFARSFSLIFGLFLGFIHSYYHPFKFKSLILNKLFYYLLFVSLIVLFIFIDVSSSLFAVSMLITTIISTIMINYSVLEYNNKVYSKILSPISKVSYEIYLVQYPVIFIMQTIEMNNILKILLTVLITVVISILIHLALSLNKKSKLKVLRVILSIAVLVFSLYGLYRFIISKDYTSDMKKLEDDLKENSKLIEEKQKEYLEKMKNEEDEWEKLLNDMDASEEKLKNVVKNLRIVGVGDSVMELAVRDLYKTFPNGYFDAVVNRTDHSLYNILKNLKDKGMLGDVIVLNLGTNGECSSECKEQYMKLIGDRKVYWVNATNPDFASFNPNLIAFAKKHKNIRIIDWISVINKHPEYLIYDRVHPTVTGCKVYAETIYNAIYQDYLDEFNKKKEEKIKEHEEKLKQKITFIGNDLLTGAYDLINKDYPTSNIITDKEFNFKKLYDKVSKELENKTISYNVVFMFDKSLELSKEEYSKLVELCKDHKVYIVTLYKSIEVENATVIDFSKDINNKDYVSFDGVHLSDTGYKALMKKIDEIIKK